MQQLFDDREAWLTEASALILSEIVLPEMTGYQRPPVRVSVGFPKGSRGGKAIAVCFARRASSDGVNEMFVSPEIDDPLRVLDCITHELIHAVLDCEHGHRGPFAKAARAVGLVGRLTTTTAGPDLIPRLKEINELLGIYPHNKMDTDAARKKDTIRQIKCQCGQCGLVLRMSRRWLDAVGEYGDCPAGCGPTLKTNV